MKSKSSRCYFFPEVFFSVRHDRVSEKKRTTRPLVVYCNLRSGVPSRRNKKFKGRLIAGYRRRWCNHMCIQAVWHWALHPCFGKGLYIYYQRVKRHWQVFNSVGLTNCLAQNPFWRRESIAEWEIELLAVYWTSPSGAAFLALPMSKWAICCCLVVAVSIQLAVPICSTLSIGIKWCSWCPMSFYRRWVALGKKFLHALIRHYTLDSL